MGIVVTIENIQRQGDGSTKGTLGLVWEEDILSSEVTIFSQHKDFTCLKDGEVSVFDETIGKGELSGTAKARIFEKVGANQICVQGRLEAKTPVWDGSKDLDENCHPIP